MLLLQKQFPSVSTPLTSSVLAKPRPDAGTNPQSLNKFQMNTTSPISTDSSPSPPSANDDNGSDANSNNKNGNSKRGTPTDEDHHKRKASADDFDDEINGQPSAKSQHTDDKSRKSILPRRKSNGGEKGQVGCTVSPIQHCLSLSCRMNQGYSSAKSKIELLNERSEKGRRSMSRM